MASTDSSIRRPTRSYAQLGQDLWVLEHTGYKQGGTFVEFGALDGIKFSNTYLLETEYDWQGLCAEPDPRNFAKLKSNRRCRLTTSCIAGATGKQVEFVMAEHLSGIKDYADADDHAAKREASAQAGNVIRLTTVSLHDCLVENRMPREIDYISVDTEGSELEILSAFPFDQWKVRLWTVEHNQTPQRDAIRALMARHGYHCLELEHDDCFSADGKRLPDEEGWKERHRLRFGVLTASEDARHQALAKSEIERIVPPGARLILVNQDLWDHGLIAGRTVIPFLEKDGSYWGAPPDDQAAIADVERLRAAGAQFLVIAWPAFWWLDHYGVWAQHLRTHYPALLSNERLHLFDLRENATT